MTLVAGPLGRVVQTLPEHGNPLVVLRRFALLDKDGEFDEDGGRQLLEWAVRTKLGQVEKRDEDAAHLVKEVATRRTVALTALRRRGHTVVRMHATPEWRLAVGLGNRANPHEVGVSLHGTYGWPAVPGSSLKGLAAAWAAESAPDDPNRATVFGTGPSPDGQATMGTVRFLDAIPAGTPVAVALDVLTPHQQQYYGGAKDVPPAEHHNPVPVHFLVLTGTFAVDLHGPVASDVRHAADWLAIGADELGAGARTTSGYGYLKVSPVPEEATA